MIRFLITFIALAICAGSVHAQEKEQASEQEHHVIDIFKPMYLSSGIPLGTKPTSSNSDVKFQLSLKASIVRNLWGKEFDFFAGYSQISVWNLFAWSSPFYDNTYIPGIYTSIPLHPRDSKEVNGQILFGYEHRSNGRDDIYSRSVNYAFFSYTALLAHDVTLQATARIGDSWYGDTHSLVLYSKYLGFLQFAAAYTTPRRNFDFMIEASPVFSSSIANITAEASYRIGRRHNNPHIFVQYHYGYDEALRDCACIEPDIMDADGHLFYNGSSPLAPRQMLRFGILLTPQRTTRCCL